MSVEAEARRALSRLTRALEKSERELGAVQSALRHAEGADFPVPDFAAADAHIGALLTFVEEQSARLEEKMLLAGGLEPGRVRRSGSGG